MAYKRIQLDGTGFVLDEAVAAAAINPGNIVEKTSAGYYQKHSTEAGFGQVAVAVEDALQGNTVDDAYAAADLVQVHILSRGIRFQALLASGNKVVIGDGLVSDGAGRLETVAVAESDSTVKQILAYAEEASDQSDSDGADTLIAVRSA